MSKILVTGGAGYIGSHTVIELLNRGDEVVIVDNFSNSQPEVLTRIETIAGKQPIFYQADLLNKEAVEEVLDAHTIDAVIHFAGLKAVGESVAKPIDYYKNNLDSTLVLLQALKERNMKNFVFSSSATVYGMNNISPLTEDLPLSTTNPYGSTKLMIEQILRDLCISDDTWSVVSLRYFNPIGAHISGLIGESPNGIPNNLMPYVTQVAVGKRDQLSVFGNDYDTPDGTGVRDYIHVVDLAKAHLKAVDYAIAHTGEEAINIGTGNGVSVLDLVQTFQEASGVEVPYEIGPRRPGDIATCYANADKAKTLLDWQAEKTLLDMCKDSWRWQSQNPDGYTEA